MCKYKKIGWQFVKMKFTPYDPFTESPGQNYSYIYKYLSKLFYRNVLPIFLNTNMQHSENTHFVWTAEQIKL